MKVDTSGEKELWEGVVHLFEDKEKVLGPVSSKLFLSEPQKMSNFFSRYKFLAKMICKKKKILELGCGEALGSTLISEYSAEYLGVDREEESISIAEKNWKSHKCRFIAEEFLGKSFGCFDAVVAFNLLERLELHEETVLFETIRVNLDKGGICALCVRNEGKFVEKVAIGMEMLFYNVLTFTICNGCVHSGRESFCGEDLLFLGCYRR